MKDWQPDAWVIIILALTVALSAIIWAFALCFTDVTEQGARSVLAFYVGILSIISLWIGSRIKRDD